MALWDQWIRNSEGFLLGYSIISKSSFEQVNVFKEKIVQVKRRPIEEIPIVLVGNKADLEKNRKVQFDEGKELAKSWNAPFFETSAKTRQNVEECIFSLARLILRSKNSQKSPKVLEKLICFSGEGSSQFFYQFMKPSFDKEDKIQVPEINKGNKNVWNVIFKLVLEHAPLRKRDFLSLRLVCKHWHERVKIYERNYFCTNMKPIVYVDTDRGIVARLKENSFDLSDFEKNVIIVHSKEAAEAAVRFLKTDPVDVSLVLVGEEGKDLAESYTLKAYSFLQHLFDKIDEPSIGIFCKAWQSKLPN